MNKGVMTVIFIAMVLGLIAAANVIEWSNPGTFETKPMEMPDSSD